MPSPTATPTEPSLPTAVISPTATAVTTTERAAISEGNVILNFLEQILRAAAEISEEAEADEVADAEDEAVDEDYFEYDDDE